MKPVLTIAGVDRTDWLKVNSCKVQRQVGGRSSCDLVLEDIGRGFVPAMGSTVLVELGANKRFAGTISNKRAAKYPGGDSIQYTLRCVDWHRIFDRRRVTYTFSAGTSVAGVCNLLNSNFLYAEGVSMAESPADVFLPEALALNFNTVTEALNKVASMTGLSYYLDFDKVLRWFSVSDTAAPFDITDSSDNWRDLQVSEDDSNYRNRQHVRTEYGVNNTTTDTIVGDGVIRAHLLTATPNGITSMTRGGVSQTFAAYPDGSKQWMWQTRVVQPTAGTATLGNGEQLVVVYTTEEQNVVTKEDAAEITARAAVEGGSGIYEAVREERNLSTAGALDAIAQGELTANGRIVTEIEYETDDDGLEPGQTQHIAISGHAIDGDFLIETVTYNWLAGGDDDILRTQVKASTRQLLAQAANWTAYYQRLIEMARIGPDPEQIGIVTDTAVDIGDVTAVSAFAVEVITSPTDGTLLARLPFQCVQPSPLGAGAAAFAGLRPQSRLDGVYTDHGFIQPASISAGALFALYVDIPYPRAGGDVRVFMPSFHDATTGDPISDATPYADFTILPLSQLPIPDAQLFQAGTLNKATGVYSAVFHYEEPLKTRLEADLAAMIPATDPPNLSGFRLYVRKPSGSWHDVSGSPIPLSAFSAENGSEGKRIYRATYHCETSDIPATPETWRFLLNPENADGTPKTDGDGNPAGKYVDLVTLEPPESYVFDDLQVTNPAAAAPEYFTKDDEAHTQMVRQGLTWHIPARTDYVSATVVEYRSGSKYTEHEFPYTENVFDVDRGFYVETLRPDTGLNATFYVVANSKQRRGKLNTSTTPSVTVAFVGRADAPQVTGFSVTVVPFTAGVPVPSGLLKFAFNVPVDENWMELVIERRKCTDITYNTFVSGSTWDGSANPELGGVVEITRMPRQQVEPWQLPDAPEFWKFRARSRNWKGELNDTNPPTSNVQVPSNTGVKLNEIDPTTVLSTVFEVVSNLFRLKGRGITNDLVQQFTLLEENLANVPMISATRIYDAAITRAKIALLAVNSLLVEEVGAGKITSGSFIGRELYLNKNGVYVKVANEYDIGGYAGLTVMNDNSTNPVAIQPGFIQMWSSTSFGTKVFLSGVGDSTLRLYDSSSNVKAALTAGSFGGSLNLYGASAGITVDGSSGMTVAFQYLKPSGLTGTLIFKGGILVSAT